MQTAATTVTFKKPCWELSVSSASAPKRRKTAATIAEKMINVSAMTRNSVRAGTYASKSLTIAGVLFIPLDGGQILLLVGVAVIAVVLALALRLAVQHNSRDIAAFERTERLLNCVRRRHSKAGYQKPCINKSSQMGQVRKKRDRPAVHHHPVKPFPRFCQKFTK